MSRALFAFVAFAAPGGGAVPLGARPITFAVRSLGAAGLLRFALRFPAGVTVRRRRLLDRAVPAVAAVLVLSSGRRAGVVARHCVVLAATALFVKTYARVSNGALSRHAVMAAAAIGAVASCAERAHARMPALSALSACLPAAVATAFVRTTGFDVERVVDTPRLRLRPCRPTDLRALHRLVGDAQQMRYVGTKADATLDDTRERMIRIAIHWEKFGFGSWIVERRDSRKAIGLAGLHKVARSGDVALSLILIDPAYGGLGFATEAMRASLRFAFERLDVGHVVAVAHLDNLASRRIIEGMGFRLTDFAVRDDRRGEWRIERATWNQRTYAAGD